MPQNGAPLRVRSRDGLALALIQIGQRLAERAADGALGLLRESRRHRPRLHRFVASRLPRSRSRSRTRSQRSGTRLRTRESRFVVYGYRYVNEGGRVSEDSAFLGIWLEAGRYVC